MSEGDAEPVIRHGRPEEYDRFREIERVSEVVFAAAGIGPFPEDDLDHLAVSAVVLATGEPPVGFASVGIVDGVAHLWQISVDPSVARRGLGTALVNSVCQWAREQGYGAVTLTSFRDVPWNGPFYAKLGFRPVERPSSGLAAIRQHEKDIGDDDLGPRIAMRKDLLA